MKVACKTIKNWSSYLGLCVPPPQWQNDRHVTVNMTFPTFRWSVVTNDQTEINTDLYTFSLTDCLTFLCCHGDRGDPGFSRDLCPSSPCHWAASSSAAPAAETKNRPTSWRHFRHWIVMTSLIKESPDWLRTNQKIVGMFVSRSILLYWFILVQLG